MTEQYRPDGPRLTVIGSLNNALGSGSLKQLFADGSAEIAIGSAVASGFGVEAVKSLMTGEANGRWWFVLACVVGVGSIAYGFVRREHLRRRLQRQVRVGIVVTAADSARSLVYARQLDGQAEAYSRSTCAITIKSDVQLPTGGTAPGHLIEALADRTIEAMAMAEQLSPNAIQIDLIPTMRLHAAFWYGARLGHTHSRSVMVHEPSHTGDTPSHFPAVRLIAGEPEAQPLTVHGVEPLSGGDPTLTALALDLQARGEAFYAPVRKTCQEEGIGNLLRLSSPVERLAENTETFTAAVAQVCRAWIEAQLPDGARTGRHAIFLSGPVAVSVALGARLASADHGRWTAYTYDPANNTYEPFLSAPTT
ncbi:SAVED domain-containing protein [Actinomadura napierensis]|uniref:SAVED domain-containing protein n=1 Tax=Actinomadura napierensis TaxID=267854 RepID=A0ABN3AES0_9ACTN